METPDLELLEKAKTLTTLVQVFLRLLKKVQYIQMFQDPLSSDTESLGSFVPQHK